MTAVSVTLGVDARTVGEARRFLVRALKEWGATQYLFGAPQVLSELATNAALHTHGNYTVTLRHEPESQSLLIEVTDASGRLPQQRQYAIDATTGRGMNLVAALSVDWGTKPVPGGKTVWARIAPDPPEGASADDVDELESHGPPGKGPVDLRRPDAGTGQERARACA